MDAAAEIGRNTVSKLQIQPEYGDEQADAGRDCRTRLARPNSRAPTGTGDREIFIFPDQRTTSRIDNLTRLMITLAICDDHTHIIRMIDDVVKVLRRDIMLYPYISTSYFSTYYSEDLHAIFWEAETK